MKLALLGTGMIVKEVLPVLKEIEGIDLRAILSTERSLPTAQALASDYGIDFATSDLQEILTDVTIDTVYIGTPNHTHYNYAKAVIEAGKHVICEKPFTLTLAEFEDLADLAKTNGVYLFEAITNQYLENFAYLKEQLPTIGDVKIVECNFSQYSSRYDAFKRGELAPVFNPEMGGGALRDLNIYNIHLLVGLFGKPEKVIYLPNIERGVDTSGILLLDYGHFKAVAIGSKDSSAEVVSTIQGDKGSLVVHGPTNSLPKLSLTMNGQERQEINLNQNHHRMVNEFKVFQDILATQNYSQMQKQLDHSRLVMQILDEAVKSM